MTYIIDTHIFIWFLDENKRLNSEHHQILTNRNNNFIFSAIVLAEIKHLILKKRIKVDFKEVIDHLGASRNCIIYPVDEDIIENMPVGLDIHDALIVATGLVYKNVLGQEVKILTEDNEIIKSNILPVI